MQPGIPCNIRIRMIDCGDGLSGRETTVKRHALVLEFDKVIVKHSHRLFDSWQTFYQNKMSAG